MDGRRDVRPLGHPRLWLRLHASATIFWLLMAVPALLVWPDSVTAVTLTSLYANSVVRLAP